jgi:hypothetical protein
MHRVGDARVARTGRPKVRTPARPNGEHAIAILGKEQVDTSLTIELSGKANQSGANVFSVQLDLRLTAVSFSA